MTFNELTNNPDYCKIEEFDHNGIKNFVKQELAGNQGWGLIAKIYQGAGLLLFGFALIKAFAPYMRMRETIMLEWLGWGVLFCFTALIIIHELLHLLAYIIVGARRLSVGMNLKRFLFYVQADKQILNYNKFKIVALAPLLVVAVVSITGAIVFFEQPLYYFFLAVLGLHSLFCAGDLGMLCFFENRPDDEIYTFDVKDEGKTYFYKGNSKKINP